MFPYSSAVKASYDAIHDSLGLTIDRIGRCEAPDDFRLACPSHKAHTCECFRCSSQFFNALVVEYSKLFIIADQSVFIKVGLGFVHMLEQEGRVEVPLYSPPIRHVVPALTQRFLFVVVCQMVILAGSDFRIYSHYPVQPT